MALGGFQHVVVGTRDLERSLSLYCTDLGLALLSPVAPVPAGERELWALPPGYEANAATIGMPGATSGLIRLVTFGAGTGAPVREGARPYDSSPKNLDFSVLDVDAAYARLRERGHSFRTEPTHYEHGRKPIGEVQMMGPDEVNVVLLQFPDLTPAVHTPEGFAGVVQWVLTVGDRAPVIALLRDGLGLPLIRESLIKGPEIERMLGLPPGTELNTALMGGATPSGLIQLVEYSTVQPRDLTADARPPRSGLLHVGFTVPDLRESMARLTAAGATPFAGPVQSRDPLGREAEAASLVGPGGLLIELWTPA